MGERRKTAIYLRISTEDMHFKENYQGRMEIIQAAWENHPEFFTDYRVLPALAAGLGDGYGEISELNTTIMKKLGPTSLPLLKKDFDPAGNRAMVRRVEVISAIEGTEATP